MERKKQILTRTAGFIIQWTEHQWSMYDITTLGITRSKNCNFDFFLIYILNFKFLGSYMYMILVYSTGQESEFVVYKVTRPKSYSLPGAWQVEHIICLQPSSCNPSILKYHEFMTSAPTKKRLLLLLLLFSEYSW